MRERPDAPLGTLIFRAGLLPAETIENALEEGVKTGRRLGEILVERGLIKEEDLTRLLAGQKGLPFVSLREQSVDAEAARLLAEDQARLFTALPIGFEDGVPVVAVADPTNDVLNRNIREALGQEARFVVATRSELNDAIGELFSGAPSSSPAIDLSVPAPEFEAEPAVETEPVAMDQTAPEPEPYPECTEMHEAPPETDAAAEPVGMHPAAPGPEQVAEPVEAEHASPESDPAPEPVGAGHAPPAPEPEATVEPEPETAAEPAFDISAYEPDAQPTPEPEPVAAEPAQPEPEQAPAPSAPDVEPPVVPEPPLAPLTTEPVAAQSIPQSNGEVPKAFEDAPPPPAAADAGYRVSIRFTSGERMTVAECADASEARGYAKALTKQLGATGSDDWPFVNGRFLKPDTIVSVDVETL